MHSTATVVFGPSSETWETIVSDLDGGKVRFVGDTRTSACGLLDSGAFIVASWEWLTDRGASGGVGKAVFSKSLVLGSALDAALDAAYELIRVVGELA